MFHSLGKYNYKQLEVFNIQQNFWSFQIMKGENKNHDLLGGGVVEAKGAELPVP